MGNKNSKIHLETAQKTGACTLSKLGLEEIPADVFKILKLRSLDVSQNKLENLAIQVSNLVNLKMLNISSNRIHQINQNIISKLTKIESFSAHSNLIMQMPSFQTNKHLKKVC